MLVWLWFLVEFCLGFGLDLGGLFGVFICLFFSLCRWGKATETTPTSETKRKLELSLTCNLDSYSGDCSVSFKVY